MHKKCPNCKFKKCWVKARICEECGYDFITKRKPVKEVELPPKPLPKPPEPPKSFHKVCPNCKYDKVWHLATICEKCNWDQRKTVEEVTTEKKRVTRSFLGYRPIFSQLKHQPWMDDFNGGDLREWATNFIQKLKEMLGVEQIFTPCILDWLEHSKNPQLKSQKHQLEQWYQRHGGISSWEHLDHLGCWRGWMLTPDEQVSECLSIKEEKIAVQRLFRKDDGSTFVYISVMDKEEADTFREQAKERYLAYTNSLKLLPDNWDKMSSQEQTKWATDQGYPIEPLPARKINVRTKYL